MLISKNQFSGKEDSTNLWERLPLPLYKDLIGKTYLKKESLPQELAMGQFETVGKDQNYCLCSIGNIYNKNYSYIFFEKINNPGTVNLSYTILDIVVLNSAKFRENTTIWFKQCTCKDQSKDCSDVVAIYSHNEEMAKKDIIVKPDKAWRPNYKTQKLELISPETVSCGSIAPEESDDNGP